MSFLKSFIVFCIPLTLSFLAKGESDVTMSLEDSRQPQVVSYEDFCKNFSLLVEEYITDISGKHFIQQLGENREYNVGFRNGLKECSSDAGFSSGSSEFVKNGVVMSLNLKVSQDKTVTLLVKEYKDIEFNEKRDQPHYKNLLLEKTFTLKDFGSLIWNSSNAKNDKYKTVIRLTPRFKNLIEPIDAKDILIGGKNLIVYDQSGQVWVNNLTISGKFIGFKTHKGTVLLSYYPFPGARRMGEIVDNTLTLKSSTTTLLIRSDINFLPIQSSYFVYGKIDLTKRSPKITSVMASSSSSQDKFFENIKKW